jgi:carboxyl-terminal processing protease
MRWLVPMVGLGVAVVSSATWLALRSHSHEDRSSTVTGPAASSEPRPEPVRWSERLAGRALAVPTGVPAQVSCADARRVIAQARMHLAATPAGVDARVLAEATVDWLDPHGLWSAAPDAPLAAYLRKHDKELLGELESSSSPCRTAAEAGALLSEWIQRLASTFDEAFRAAPAATWADALRAAAEPAFEDHTVARPARALADDLGRAIGTASRSLGAPVASYVQAARQRFLPALTASQWGDAVLAASLRAYLPQVDPHGAWAPLDEETSLYEVDLEASPPPRLWDHMVRTALGVRVESEPAAPLEPHDLVLEISRVALGGLSVEQVEQLAIVDMDGDKAARSVVVLRPGDSAPRTLEVVLPDERPEGDTAAVLPTERIAYADGEALVIEIGDVPDDLGDLLASTIARARSAGLPRGIILDLRGNGGGSTDGANAAIGLFLPGVPLFPMRRRDGVVETERAPEPPETDRWAGPVAVLVDGDTASAAEMIAGALASYRRASVAGVRTYGKGCAQEYLDDQIHVGVLRLTTLVYALPDGTPVQKVGLVPGLYLGHAVASERESSLSHALPSWRGPDVRDPTRIADVPWPLHHGHVGPCRDDAVCRTLRALGASHATVARGRR